MKGKALPRYAVIFLVRLAFAKTFHVRFVQAVDFVFVAALLGEHLMVERQFFRVTALGQFALKLAHEPPGDALDAALRSPRPFNGLLAGATAQLPAQRLSVRRYERRSGMPSFCASRRQCTMMRTCSLLSTGCVMSFS